MRKNILVPTDFSKNAWNALNYALNLYKNEKCTFYLLNAFPLYHFPTDTLLEPAPGEPNYEQAKQKSQAGLKKTIDDLNLNSKNPEHRLEMISKYDTVLNAIREAIDTHDIELIVMGTKGESNPVNRVYGSTAVDVMGKINNATVLVTPEGCAFSNDSKKEIVFATNYKHYYKARELADLIEVAKQTNAAIRILYVQDHQNLTPEQEENKESLQDFFSEIEHSFHTLTNIKVVAGVQSFIESRGSHMLALMHRKHGFFVKIFTKPLVKEIAYKPRVPILVLQEIS